MADLENKKYPVRKRNRLREWDYSTPHWYFITIYTQNYHELFGEIIKGKMISNEYGKIIQKRWLWLKEQYNYVNLNEFIVIPNHFHGILIIVGSGRNLIKNNERCKNGQVPTCPYINLLKLNQYQN